MKFLMGNFIFDAVFALVFFYMMGVYAVNGLKRFVFVSKTSLIR